MPGISNEAKRTADKVVLTAFRARADADGLVHIRKQAFADELGLSLSTISTSMERLKGRALIDVESAGDKRTDGLLVVVDMGEAARRDKAEVVVPIAAAPKQLRKCPKCGTEASNEQASFCWKCGASMKTDDELLQEKFSRIIAKLPHTYGSRRSDELDEDLKVLWAIYNKAFKRGGVK